MPEAPRKRPADAVVLRSFAGHITARPKAVFDALEARFRPTEGSSSLYAADAAAFLVVTQSGRWYRGEYRVVPDALGSNVEHHLVTVAPRRRIGRFSGRRIVERAPEQFDRLIRQLRLELE